MIDPIRDNHQKSFLKYNKRANHNLVVNQTGLQEGSKRYET